MDNRVIDFTEYRGALISYEHHAIYSYRRCSIAPNGAELLKEIGPVMYNEAQVLWSVYWEWIERELHVDDFNDSHKSQLDPDDLHLSDLLEILDRCIKQRVAELEEDTSNTSDT